MNRPAMRVILTLCVLWLLAIPLGYAADSPPGSIGVNLFPSSGEMTGPWIGSVTPGGRADRAGLKPSDVIVSIDNKPVMRPDDVTSTLQEYARQGHADVSIGIVRNRQALSITVPLITRVASPPAAAAPPKVAASEPQPAPSVAPAPQAQTGGSVIEPRLGMEFGPRLDGKRGAVIVRNWNTTAIGKLPASALRQGDVVDVLFYVLAAPNQSGQVIEDGYPIQFPGYISTLLDGILASPLKRHDAVVLHRIGDDTAIVVGLLPVTIPAPAPSVATAPKPAPVPATVTRSAAVATTPPVDKPMGTPTPASGFSVNVTLIMSALVALMLIAFAVARRKGWGRGFAFRPATAVPAGYARAMPGSDGVEDDDEEREIALARQAVETAERSPIQGPIPSETGGPSWLQQQRERREVERAKRGMEEAERAAARGQAPLGHYPYPPPPYGYQQRRPLSEWLRTAYWGLKIALVLVVAIWAWSVTGTVVSMLGAIVPAPLRAVTVDLLSKAQDAISKADKNGQ